MRKLHQIRPSASMVVACLSLFAALGGVGYAAAAIDSGAIVDNSIRSKDVRNRGLRGGDLRKNTLGGAQIRESKLAEVPSATNADHAADSAALAGSPASAYVKGDARGLAVAGATIEDDGTLRSWFNRAGGAPDVSGGGDDDGDYLVEFPGVAASLTTHVATANLIGAPGMVTVDFNGGRLHMRTWDGNVAADTFEAADHSYTVVVHPSGPGG
jgi:hypothetical protein